MEVNNIIKVVTPIKRITQEPNYTSSLLLYLSYYCHYDRVAPTSSPVKLVKSFDILVLYLWKERELEQGGAMFEFHTNLQYQGETKPTVAEKDTTTAAARSPPTLIAAA